MRNNQQGSALVLSLVILLVMTLLGITAMNTSVLEEKMAANDRHQKLAFQNAESGLSQAEQTLLDTDWYGPEGLSNAFNTDNNGYFKRGEATPAQRAASTLACAPGTPVAGGKRPCLMIENMGITPPITTQQYGSPSFATQISRITTRGTTNGGTTVLLQSHFQKELTP